MRIAILHYHLHAGGVSRIIDLAVQALREGGHEVAVLAGSAPHARSLLDHDRVGIVPGLNYTTECGDVAALGKALDATARSILGGTPDVWHFHNPTLGKNPMVPMLAARWAKEERALVLQLHDFPEEERPANYRVLLQAAASQGITLQGFLYPTHSHVCYAVLTSHAAALLAAAGLPRKARVLPNPVQALPMRSPFPPATIDAEEYLVYPTRAIARKNLGEAILWATTLKRGQKLVITLAPEDPVARVEHDLWEEFAIRHQLPVVFDSVTRLGRPLGDLIAGSCAAITTSIREGFGMAYLEPWLLGVPVVGRDLPKVTRDFREEGMAFDWLYHGIPVELTQEERMLHAVMLRQQRETMGADYGVVLGEISLPGKIDFGDLHASLQRRLLERWLRDGFPENALPDLQIEYAATHVSQYQEILKKRFGLADYGQRLVTLYQQAIAGTGAEKADSFLDPAAVLAQFLKT